MMRSREERFMRDALNLAKLGRGLVEPNPLVGAVLARQDRIVGRGYHKQFGADHAEVEAIRSCATARNATMYVTLEPCSHHGKKPPCTDAIIKAGIRRVVAACKDPSEHANGKGFRMLREAGIEVEVGVLEKEACALNAPFFKLTTTGLPYVTVKWAMTLDGKIATAGGRPARISNDRSRRHVHALRSNMDAIMVGVNTVVRDDPLLTVRHARARRTPVRIVLDFFARTPLTSALVQTATSVDTLIVASAQAPRDRIKALEDAGCVVLKVNPQGDRHLDLRNLLSFLGQRHFTNVLIEGGGEVIASAFADRVVDRVVAFVAPKIVGGRDSITPVEGDGILSPAQAITLHKTTVRRVDDDLLIEGLVEYPG